MTAITNVELLYFDDCPNWPMAQAMLDQLLAEHAPERQLLAIRIESEADAVEHRFLGSPTIRIDGRDVEPGAEDRRDYGMQCRVYRTERGLRGVPDDAWIRAGLQQQS